MIDKHHYPLPAVYDNPVNQRAVVCGEYGGINLKIDNHIWAGSEVNYTTVNSAEDLKRLFIEYAGKVEELKNRKDCVLLFIPRSRMWKVKSTD